jgi:protein SCO1/2
VGLAAGCGSSHPKATATAPAATTGGGLYGLVPSPLPRKPDFTLTDTSGRAYDLGRETAGKLTYLYFGYTHCTNACPATMSLLSYAIRQQPAVVRRRIVVVFVTVDQRRDTLKVLRTWLDHYSNAFVGLRGTPQQIDAAEEAACVPPAPRETQSGGDYSVPHSSLLFAYSPDGLSHVIYATGFSSIDYGHDMPLLLRFDR